MARIVRMLDSWRRLGEAFQEPGKLPPRNIAFPRSATQPFWPDYLYFMMNCLIFHIRIYDRDGFYTLKSTCYDKVPEVGIYGQTDTKICWGLIHRNFFSQLLSQHYHHYYFQGGFMQDSAHFVSPDTCYVEVSGNQRLLPTVSEADNPGERSYTECCLGCCCKFIKWVLKKPQYSVPLFFCLVGFATGGVAYGLSTISGVATASTLTNRNITLVPTTSPNPTTTAISILYKFSQCSKSSDILSCVKHLNKDEDPRWINPEKMHLDFVKNLEEAKCRKDSLFFDHNGGELNQTVSAYCEEMNSGEAKYYIPYPQNRRKP